MKKKVVAGILAFICTFNAVALYSGSGYNTARMLTGFSEASITAHAESLELPNHITESSGNHYYNNAYYNHSLTLDEETCWTEGAYTYGFMTDTISHQETNADGEMETINDTTVVRIALVSIDPTVRLTSIAPNSEKLKFNKEVNSIILSLAEQGMDPGDKCTAIYAEALVSGGRYLKDVDLSGIEIIGDRAFAGCEYITEMEIPTTVEYMGSGVFQGSGVKTVNFKNEFTKIPDSTFEDTPLSVVSFYRASKICEIGENAFANTALTVYPMLQEASNTVIRNGAFSGCKQLKELNLSDNIIFVGDEAFSGCTSLSSLKTGSKCCLIGNNAFNGCTSLTSITLNDGLRYIGSGAFKDCTSLVNGPEMPDTVSFRFNLTGNKALLNAYIASEEAIEQQTADYTGHSVYGDGASSCSDMFAGCTALKSVKVPSTADIIPESYCRDCTSLTNVAFGTNVTSIYNNAFENCSNLQDIVLSDVQGYIGKNAFYQCGSLKAMFSNEISVINSGAFKGCSSISKIDVKSLACMEEAFADCTSLTDVKLSSNMYGAYIFSGCSSLANAAIDLVGATSTPDGMFNDCIKLTSLKGTNLSKIQIVGDFTFSNCQSLKEIDIPSLVIVGESAFNNCVKLTKINNLAESKIQDFGAYCFYNCNNLQRVIGDNGVVSTIGASAFENSGINEMHIVGTVGDTLVIDDNAFKNCDKLVDASIEIETSSMGYEVGSNIFENCSALQTLTYLGPEIPAGFVADCTSLKTVNLADYTTVSDNAFSGCSALRELNTASLLSVGDRAFENCKSLIDPKISNTTTYSGESQYTGCTSLKEVSVYKLTPNMFKGCSRLETVNLASYISVVEAGTFMDCTSLKNINLGKITEFKEDSFNNSGLYTLDLGQSRNINTIGTCAFANCANLRKVTCTAGKIGNNAFNNCGLLTEVNIHTLSIGDMAFSDCPSLYIAIFEENGAYNLTEIGDRAFYNTMVTDFTMIDEVYSVGTDVFGYGNESIGPEDVTIYGEKGSFAEEYAKSEGYKFLDYSKYSIEDINKKKEMPGDVNADGVISVVDAVLLQRWLLAMPVSGIYGPNMDLNKDNRVDCFDLCFEKRLLLKQMEANGELEEQTTQD